MQGLKFRPETTERDRRPGHPLHLTKCPIQYRLTPADRQLACNARRQ